MNEDQHKGVVDVIPERLVNRISKMMIERKTGHIKIHFKLGSLKRWEAAEFEGVNNKNGGC